MEDCVELAKKLGKRVGDELEIPVYLYENAAQSEDRRNLANVRKGEYEGLEEKLKKPEWNPDFGPAVFNRKSGALAISAREFLIAYNIDLNTKNKKHATDIAFELREKGRSVRADTNSAYYFKGDLVKYRQDYFPCTECNLEFVAKNVDDLEAHYQREHGFSIIELLAEHGTTPENIIGRSVKKRGIFTHCKAIGWVVEEYGRAQISINLTNYKITPPHIVLEKARKLAAERGLIVTGSEIVGLVPYQAMLMAGKYYLEKQGSSTGIPPQDIIEAAIYSMGLNDVALFDPDDKIIGMPKTRNDSLIEMKTGNFIDEVSRSSPAPGGGSVAALAGSLGAALSSMVANLTVPKQETHKDALPYIKIAERAQDIRARLSVAIDDDTQAFNDYLEAIRLPKKTKTEAETRQVAIQEGLKTAVNVPLNTSKASLEALMLSLEIGRTGNLASVSDAGVGAEMAFAGLMGGILNVLINLGEIEDRKFIVDMKKQCEELEKHGRQLLGECLEVVRTRIDQLTNKKGG